MSKNTITITAAVGEKAPNKSKDVTSIQVLLNHYIGTRKLTGIPGLAVDGKIGPKTKQAITMFQFQNGIVTTPEHFAGQIRPGGKTITFMNRHLGAMPKKVMSSSASSMSGGEGDTVRRSNSNLTFARWALNHTRAALKLGAGNKLSDIVRSGGASSAMLLLNRLITPNPGVKLSLTHVEGIAKRSVEFGSGNCGEHAAVAFVYLNNRLVRPIDLMTRVNADHSFVVIGRQSGSDQTKPATWGAEAAVCDAWQGNVYWSNEIDQKMGGGGRVTPISLIQRTRTPLPDNVG